MESGTNPGTAYRFIDVYSFAMYRNGKARAKRNGMLSPDFKVSPDFRISCPPKSAIGWDYCDMTSRIRVASPGFRERIANGSVRRQRHERELRTLRRNPECLG